MFNSVMKRRPLGKETKSHAIRPRGKPQGMWQQNVRNNIMEKCLFCKIINGEKGELIYKDEQTAAFNDIDPKAPNHVLIVPIKHIATINDTSDEDEQLLGHMVQVAKKLAKELDIAEDGYRLVFNCNRGGGQAVFHIHLHLLGGRSMSWPPG